MNRNLRILTVLGALSVSCYAGGDLVTPVEPIVDVPAQEMTSDNNYFVYLAGGMGLVNVDESINANAQGFKNEALDDKGGLIELGAGYRLNDNVFATIAAQRTMLDLVDIDNFYASINYQFSDVTANPYIGAVVGYSKLEWTERPHEMIINEDLTSDGPVYGVQVGLEQALSNNLSVFGKYQFMKYDHLMDIRSLESTIEHTYGQNLLAGVRYEF